MLSSIECQQRVRTSQLSGLEYQLLLLPLGEKGGHLVHASGEVQRQRLLLLGGTLGQTAR
jgi:hypothetical protein